MKNNIIAVEIACLILSASLAACGRIEEENSQTTLTENTAALTAETGSAAPEPADDNGEEDVFINELFTYESFRGSRMTLPYRKAVINENAEGLPALVICLHGHSACGSDNERQLRKEGVRGSTRFFMQSGSGAIILAPQCPEDLKWRNGRMIETLRDLISLYEDQVDKSRIYILGDSLGGGGTWAMAAAYPGLFAAAMPAVSIPVEDLTTVASTPVCSVIGDLDDVVTEDAVLPQINRLRDLGADVRFEIIGGADHQTACREAFSVENLTWVFSHSRTDTPV